MNRRVNLLFNVPVKEELNFLVKRQLFFVGKFVCFAHLCNCKFEDD